MFEFLLRYQTHFYGGLISFLDLLDYFYEIDTNTAIKHLFISVLVEIFKAFPWQKPFVLECSKTTDSCKQANDSCYQKLFMQS